MRRWLCFDEWQTGKIESWLEAWAAKGWHLQKMGRFIATFRRGEPACMRYRCDVNPDSAIGLEERKLIYQSAGWDYVSSHGNISVFCTGDGNAPEIHSDPWEYAETFRKLRKNNLASLIMLPICVAMYLAVFFVDPVYFSKNILIEGNIIYICVVCEFSYLTYRAAKCLVTVSATSRRMASGVPIKHDRPYKASLISKRIVLPCLTLVFLAFFSAGIYDLVHSFSEFAEPPVPAGELKTVRMSDIKGLSQFKPDGDSYDNYYRVQRSTLVPEQIYLEEGGTLSPAVSGEADGSITSERYRALTPGLARLLALDLARMSRVAGSLDGGWGALPYSEDNGRGFDALWYYDNPAGDGHEVVAQKGFFVYHVVFHGPVGCDAIVALLQNRSEQKQ